MSSGESSVAGSESAATEAPSVDWIRGFIREWLEAWNSREADRDDSWPKTMHGHDDVREFLSALWRAVPDMHFELLDGPYVIPGEPRATFHWRGGGTFTGRMDPPGFAPTGRRWEIDGVDLQEYRDGRICRLRVVFDMMSVSRQLGVMPPTGSQAESALAAVQRAVVWTQDQIGHLKG
jgi:predicted ester cyclase